MNRLAQWIAALLLAQQCGAQAPGTVLWKYAPPSAYFGGWDSSPVLGVDGTIYVGAASALHAVAPNGTNKWVFEPGGYGLSCAVIGDDRTIYWACGTNLFAVNPDGSEKWRFATGYDIQSSPALTIDGTTYIASQDGNLYAVTPDGSRKWQYPTGDVRRAAPAIGSDGTIYIGDYYGHFFALNPDGTLKWETNLVAGVQNSPSIGKDGTIYVVAVGAGNVRALLALNPDGSERWASPEPNLGSSPVLGKDGTLYVGSFWPSRLYAISPTDGSVLWSRADGLNGSQWMPSAPAVADNGVIYYGNLDYPGGSYLYSFNPDGTTNWTVSTRPPPGYSGSEVTGSPAIAPDGTIYFSTLYSLYAVKGNSPLANTPWPKYRQNLRNTGKVERPKLLSPVRTTDYFECLVFGELGGSYTVQGSTNLGDWTPLTNFLATTNRTRFVDPLPVGATHNFYRVVMP
jgi:outer membrane protein assembly factor BamB